MSEQEFHNTSCIACPVQCHLKACSLLIFLPKKYNRRHEYHKRISHLRLLTEELVHDVALYVFKLQRMVVAGESAEDTGQEQEFIGKSERNGSLWQIILYILSLYLYFFLGMPSNIFSGYF